MTKILAFDELAGRVAQLRAEGKTVVQCHGVFDLLHIGHIRYLQKAAELADALVVTITPDHFVNKGPHRPVFTQSLRVDAVAALECVCFAAINEWPTAVEAIQQLAPNYYAKGAEYRNQKTPELLREEAAIGACGGEMRYVDEFTSSSSQLINNYLSPFGEATQQYLSDFKNRRGEDDVRSAIRQFAPVRPVVIGEAVIDESFSCSAIGRSSKAPVVATQYRSHSRFVGGSVALANNLAAFTEQVELIALVGDDGEEQWIESQLRDNVKMTAVTKREAPTIRERRYHESYFDTPLFEVNYFDDRPLHEHEAKEILDAVAALPERDLVVAADAGHTMLEGETVDAVCGLGGLLAVKTRANAANFGRNTVSKYRRADLACLAHNELELECRRSGNLESMLSEVAGRLAAERVLVTLGKNGCAGVDAEGESEFAKAEGLAVTVVDRTGGGDAFFALSALATAAKCPLDVTMFLANVAGAEAVAMVGGAQFVQPAAFERHALSLLK